jgi:hypothetical protein
LPPYCPHLNPIEVGFAQLKKWIQKFANLTFGTYPKEILDIAMRDCVNPDHALRIIMHSGYRYNHLVRIE